MAYRRLPHIYPRNRWLFITWRLHGSLPHGHFPPARKTFGGEAFAWIIATWIPRLPAPWNPVKAGLASKPEDCEWSSASPQYARSVHTSVNATSPIRILA
jgi:hypothetical protein